jgi:hypothetical protein
MSSGTFITSPEDIAIAPDLEKIDVLRARRREILAGDADCDYDDLQRIDNEIDAVYQSVQRYLCDEAQEAELSTLDTRIHQTKSALLESHEQFAAVRRIHEERHLMLTESLVRMQKSEWEALDRVLAGAPPPRFRKLSAELLAKRRSERALRLTHRFAEAKVLRNETAAMEASEMEGNAGRWREYGDRRRAEMRHRHEAQMQCLDERIEREWQVLVPVSVSQQSHCQMVIESRVRRKAEVQASPNDFRTQTTRSVQKAIRDQWPQVTARRTSGQSSPMRTPRQSTFYVHQRKIGTSGVPSQSAMDGKELQIL